MEQRYAVNPGQIVGMDTAELRDRFLISDLFVPGQVTRHLVDPRRQHRDLNLGAPRVLLVAAVLRPGL